MHTNVCSALCSLPLGVYPARVALFNGNLQYIARKNTFFSSRRSDISQEEEFNIDTHDSKYKPQSPPLEQIGETNFPTSNQQQMNYTRSKPSYISGALHGNEADIPLQFGSSSVLVGLVRSNQRLPDSHKSQFYHINRGENHHTVLDSVGDEMTNRISPKDPRFLNLKDTINPEHYSVMNYSYSTNNLSLSNHNLTHSHILTKYSNATSIGYKSILHDLYNDRTTLQNKSGEQNHTSGRIISSVIEQSKTAQGSLDSGIGYETSEVIKEKQPSTNESIIEAISDDQLPLSLDGNDHFKGIFNDPREDNLSNKRQMDPRWMHETLSKLNRVVDSILKSIATGDIRVNDAQINISATNEADAERFTTNRTYPKSIEYSTSNYSKTIKPILSGSNKNRNHSSLQKINSRKKKRRRRGRLKKKSSNSRVTKHVRSANKLKIGNNTTCTNDTVNGDCVLDINSSSINKIPILKISDARNNIKYIIKNRRLIHLRDSRIPFRIRHNSMMHRLKRNTISRNNNESESRDVENTDHFSGVINRNRTKERKISANLKETHQVLHDKGPHKSIENAAVSHCLPQGTVGRLVVDGEAMSVIGGYTLEAKQTCWTQVTSLVHKHIETPLLTDQRVILTSTFYFIARTAGLIGA